MSNIPRKEYPRPQFVRENWMNLNGTWAFEIDNGRSGEANFPVCSTRISCTVCGISAL